MLKICVVDDTPDILQNLSDFLEMEGFEVWRCKNPKEALQRFASQPPDLIITDLWMSAMDGLVFIEHVRNNSFVKDVPVIIFSAKPVQEYEHKARSLGVNAFVKKPAPLESILDEINSLFK